MYEYQFNYLENDVMDENSLASNDISAFIEIGPAMYGLGLGVEELVYIQIINLNSPLYHMILIMNGE